MHSDPDLSIQALAEQITVDAYGDEGYWSFLQAFEHHLTYPLAATVIGVAVQVSKVDFDGDEGRGLVATVVRDDHPSTISVLDLTLDEHDVRAQRLLAAYRHWLGMSWPERSYPRGEP